MNFIVFTLSRCPSNTISEVGICEASEDKSERHIDGHLTRVLGFMTTDLTIEGFIFEVMYST